MAEIVTVMALIATGTMIMAAAITTGIGAATQGQAKAKWLAVLRMTCIGTIARLTRGVECS